MARLDSTLESSNTAAMNPKPVSAEYVSRLSEIHLKAQQKRMEFEANRIMMNAEALKVENPASFGINAPPDTPS